MEVTFLGTGTSQGVPVIGCNCEVCKSPDPRNIRLRTSIHISIDGINLVVDTGPDFRQQMLREGISDLDAVLFTHPHKDHIAGMDDIRSFNFLLKKRMPVYLNELTFNQLEKEFNYVFHPGEYGGSPRIDVNIIDKNPFSINNINIIPIEVMHDKMPVLGFRINNFTYITDANHISEESIDKIIGTEVLVLNALQKGPHVSHFNLQQALEVIEILKPKRALLTHISHKMGLHKETNELLPGHISLAYDEQKIKI